MSIIEQALPRFDEVKSGSSKEESFQTLTDSRRTSHYVAGIEPTREVQLDLMQLAARGILTVANRDMYLLEQYRAIKQALIRRLANNEPNAFEREIGAATGRKKVILVTSALPKEGKTYTAINLAMSMSQERDHPVLLMDADLEKRDASTLFNIDSQGGLTEFLETETVPLADVLFRTNVENLRILPVGKAHNHHVELISSKRMKRCLTDLGRAHAAIVIDSAPLLFSSSATAMAHLADQVVIVVEAEKTPQSAVQEAVHLLGPSKNIGFVLNKDGSRTRARHQYYRRQR
jgi:protein-tyrosine kinase